MAYKKPRTVRYVALCLLLLIGQSTSQISNILYSLGVFLRDGQYQQERETEDQKNIFREYDFIIIGAGTAGCTLANRLTEIPEWKVLLIEAGSRENLIMDIPMTTTFLQFSKANWKYKTVPSDTSCLGFDKKQCNWPRGKVMGGSSVLNNMIYARGNRKDYDRWAQLGNNGWSWDEVLPYFKKIENIQVPGLRNDREYHGTKGYLGVAYAPYRTVVSEAWEKSSVEAGHRKNDYNGKTQTGVSRLQLSMFNGTRHSSNRAYLTPIRDRTNLHVIKNSMVTKLLIDANKRVTGVEFSRANQKYQIFARKEVILSAGAINSPQILMLSGIGPEAELKRMNIPIVQNLMVGYNLMDHIATGGFTFTIDRQNISYATGQILQTPSILFEWMNDRSGPLTLPGGVESVTFIDRQNPKAVDGWPDIELLQIGGSLNGDVTFRRNFGITGKIFDQVYKKLGDQQAFMVFPMVMRPKSRGRVVLKNKNPFSYPLIYANYLDHQYDVDTVVAAIRETIKITQQPSFRRIGAKLYDVPIPACEKYGFGSDRYWECHTRFFTFTVYHQCGTCKMGPPEDETAVVDPKLRVYGVSGLRVIDASIMPEIITGHTNSPTYMIAEKAADMIKEDWGKPIQPFE